MNCIVLYVHDLVHVHLCLQFYTVTQKQSKYIYMPITTATCQLRPSNNSRQLLSDATQLE